MKILAIETSCDDTGIAIVEDGIRLLSSILSSQVKTHAEYGGIVPELASRMHTEIIHDLMDHVLKDAGITLQDIDAIGVTYGPGLEGSLLVGLAVAKTLSTVLNVPLIGVNHMQGHIYALFLTETPPAFPFISLIASGGHTALVKIPAPMTFELLSETRDDAAGEAFDKVARLLGFGYPGGPHIERAAQTGNPKAFHFPRALKGKGLDFSFSGLKTAVLQQVKALDPNALPIADLAASFQAAVIDTLTAKALSACEHYDISSLSLCGGVTANRTLVQAFQDRCAATGIALSVAPASLCTDNAGMIGAAAYFSYQAGRCPDPKTITATPYLAIPD